VIDNEEDRIVRIRVGSVIYDVKLTVGTVTPFLMEISIAKHGDTVKMEFDLPDFRFTYWGKRSCAQMADKLLHEVLSKLFDYRYMAELDYVIALKRFADEARKISVSSISSIWVAREVADAILRLTRRLE
jgi:hypothetical protein